jgi:hypothetical protein
MQLNLHFEFPKAGAAMLEKKLALVLPMKFTPYLRDVYIYV